MKLITLPTSEVRPLSFYLAMEEYVARHIDEPDAFFMWQVAPSVIFGRNQVASNEVNLDYCQKNNGYMVSEQFHRVQEDVRRYLDDQPEQSTK